MSWEILRVESAKKDGWLVSGIYLQEDGVLEIEEAGYAAFRLTPEHAYYLAAQLTKWADSREVSDV